jgi:hypothetical protein
MKVLLWLILTIFTSLWVSGIDAQSSTDLPLGSQCSESSECVSRACSISDGICVCSFFDNFGCQENEICSDEECVVVEDNSVEIGGACSLTSQCIIGECTQLFGGSACTCSPTTNEGCDDDKVCAFSAAIADAPPECVSPTGGPCSGDFDCLSLKCLNGKCEPCGNEIFETGCGQGEVCIGSDETGYTCAIEDLLPFGSPCNDGSECISSICSSDGICLCSFFDNGGCQENEICADDQKCVAVEDSSVETGGACSLTSQCIIGECTPLFAVGGSVCTCSPTTNEGCDDDKVCAFSAAIADAPPECVSPTGGPCSGDFDCLSLKCLNGKCEPCGNEIFKTGCGQGEVCIGSDVTGYRCEVPVDGTPPPQCELLLDCCVEDCCGPGTSWNTSVDRCVPDASSSGFDGTHSDDYDELSCDHECCEADCCGEGTFYDETMAFCRPVAF